MEYYFVGESLGKNFHINVDRNNGYESTSLGYSQLNEFAVGSDGGAVPQPSQALKQSIRSEMGYISSRC